MIKLVTFLSFLVCVSAFPVVWEMPPLSNYTLPPSTQRLLDLAKASSEDTGESYATIQEVLDDFEPILMITLTAPVPSSATTIPFGEYLSMDTSSTVQSTEHFLTNFLASTECVSTSCVDKESESEYFTGGHEIETILPAYYTTDGTPATLGAQNGSPKLQDDSESLVRATLVLLGYPPFTLVFVLLSLGRFIVLGFFSEVGINLTAKYFYPFPRSTEGF